MSVSISGGCSHTVDPVTHHDVYDAHLSVEVTVPHLGTVLDLDMERHFGPDGRSISETITLGVGAHASTYEFGFNLPPISTPSSVSGGIAHESVLPALTGLLGGGVTGLAVRAAVAGLHDAATQPTSGGSSLLDMHDGTHISLPSWHH